MHTLKSPEVSPCLHSQTDSGIIIFHPRFTPIRGQVPMTPPCGLLLNQSSPSASSVARGFWLPLSSGAEPRARLQSGTPGAPRGSALPGAPQAVTRVSLRPAAPLRLPPRAHRAPARPFKLASVRLSGSPDSTWAHSRERVSDPRRPAFE